MNSELEAPAGRLTGQTAVFDALLEKSTPLIDVSLVLVILVIGVLVLARTHLIRRPRMMRGRKIEHPLRHATLQTSRLVLRPYRMSDVEPWYAITSDAAVMQNLRWPARSQKDSRNHLRDRTQHTRIWQADDLLALAIEKDGPFVGDVTLQLRAVAREVRCVEIGWIISPGAGGHGYATEASAAMIHLAFSKLDARLVAAVIHPDNHRSVALARRLGFTESDRTEEEALFFVTASGFEKSLGGLPSMLATVG